MISSILHCIRIIGQEVNQRRLEDVLISFKFDYLKIDGTHEESKELRNQLFDISKHRGKYPQCFIQTDDKYEFIGLWEQVNILVIVYCYNCILLFFNIVGTIQ